MSTQPHRFFCIASTLTACSIGWLAVTAGQDVNGSRSASVLEQPGTEALKMYRSSHGASWKILPDPGTGYARMIYGGSNPPLAEPGVEDEWIQVALEHVIATHGLHGIDPATLIPSAPSVRRLALRTSAGGLDKVVVAFDQWAGAYPVIDGSVKVLMSPWGDLISLQSSATPFLDQGVFTVAVDATEAMEIGTGSFRLRHQLAVELRPAEPRLVVKQSLNVDVRQPSLCWEFDCWSQPPGPRAPTAERLWVDAVTGGLLGYRSLVRNFDVSGTVYTYATPPLSNRPDLPDNQPVPDIPLVGVDVHASGGQMVRTNAQGQFSFVGLEGPVDLTIGYEGEYVTVFNWNGPDHSVTQSATGGGNVIVLNLPPHQEERTAEANAYVVVGLVANYIRDFGGDPSILDELNRVTANVNQNTGCPAGASGSEISFRRAMGNCANGAYGSVIAHELGHVLDGRSFPGPRSDGLNEGNADVWAAYVFDDSLVFRDHTGPGQGRDADNDTLFCGDDTRCGLSKFLDAQGHQIGTLWSGTAWAVRHQLNQTHGNEDGDEIANRLFLSWMQMTTNGSIHSSIQLEWMLLDDDDMDLSNLTPNFCEIRAGFAQHGWPDPCLTGCP